VVSASMLLWAKTGTPTDTVPATHPLPWHLLDVAAAAAALWDTVLPKATKEAIRAGLGVPDKDATRTWVVFLAGAHDLGKASPAFQYMKVREKAAQEPVKKLQEQMMNAGLSALERENKTRHGEISTLLLAPLLEKRNVPQTVARTLAVTVGGHHGVFPREGFAESDKEVLEVRQAGGQSNAWRKAHEDLIALLIAALGGLPEAAPTACDNATAMTLAGLVSVADWLGSDESRFVFKYPAIGDNVNAEAQDYYKKAEQTAYGALQALGWLTPPAPFVRTDWETMFPTTN